MNPEDIVIPFEQALESESIGDRIDVSCEDANDDLADNEYDPGELKENQDFAQDDLMEYGESAYEYDYGDSGMDVDF